MPDLIVPLDLSTHASASPFLFKTYRALLASARLGHIVLDMRDITGVTLI